MPFAAAVLLALVPLRPFRELAFALSVGILIDAFIVRSLLAPALLSVMGSAAEPPGTVTDDETASAAEPAPGDDPAPAARVSAGA